MKNKFFDNQLRIVEQNRLLSVHRSFLDALRNPDLDPLFDLSSETFEPYETPEAVSRYIVTEGIEQEQDFQLMIVTNALEKLDEALRVVEAQASLALQIDPEQEAELNTCLQADRDQISKMFRKATDSVRIAREALPQEMVSGFLNPLYSRVIKHFEDIAHGIIPQDILLMDYHEHIEQVSETRLNSVELVLDANEEHMRKTNRLLNEAAYLMKAEDEGIIPSSEYLDEEIFERQEKAAAAMQKSERRIRACRHYMESIFDMGSGIQDLKEFNPVRYNSAPIRDLFDFTP
jgi:hypothetical protein